MTSYIRRTIDDELDVLLASLPAVSLDGPKAVGKTETALQRATTVRRLDDPAERAIAEADPSRLVTGTRPILLDEWQRVPESWDLVRRAVDEGAGPGAFLLTGSAMPLNVPTHSGAGRIVTTRLRPMTLEERGVDGPCVSLAELLTGKRAALSGATTVGLDTYVHEIAQSGFPGFRDLGGRALRAQLDAYVARIVTRDFEESGHRLLDPDGLMRWLTAYAGNFDNRLLRGDPRRRHGRPRRQTRQDDNTAVPQRPRATLDPGPGSRLVTEPEPHRPTRYVTETSTR